MAVRALLGAILAIIVTALARSTASLSVSGQWAAIVCGVAAAMAGWAWAFALIGYFVAASFVTHFGAARKAARTSRSVPQVNERTATQVFANGALFSLLAFEAGSATDSPWALAAAGALAAASADTWATEIGTLWGGDSRSIVTWRRVATGMSGGVTAVGFLAAAAGALLVGFGVAWLLDAGPAARFALAAAGGGFVGAAADSVLGGTLQARRWCDHCKEWTERRVHPCSYRTVHAAGLRWMSNDLVNAATSAVGAVAAVAIAQLWH